jgi:hypothetical protein
MVVITPTASYSGSNVLQSRARPADAGPGPTPPAFTGVTEPPKRRLGHQGDAPSRVLFGQPGLNSSPFLLMAEKKDQSSHGALPNLEPAKRVLQ